MGVRFPEDFAMVSAPRIGALPAKLFWEPSLLKSVPGFVLSDDREGAPADNVFWAGDGAQAGGRPSTPMQSAWLAGLASRSRTSAAELRRTL